MNGVHLSRIELLILAAPIIALSSCIPQVNLDGAVIRCAATEDCPGGTGCVDGICRALGTDCVRDDGTLSALGTPCEVEGNICVRGICSAPRCGDGFVSEGEECDGEDGCRPSTQVDGGEIGCVFPVCGDGFVDPGESCDDVNDEDCDARRCATTCTGNAVACRDDGCTCDFVELVPAAEDPLLVAVGAGGALWRAPDGALHVTSLDGTARTVFTPSGNQFVDNAVGVADGTGFVGILKVFGEDAVVFEVGAAGDAVLHTTTGGPQNGSLFDVALFGDQLAWTDIFTPGQPNVFVVPRTGGPVDAPAVECSLVVGCGGKLWCASLPGPEDAFDSTAELSFVDETGGVAVGSLLGGVGLGCADDKVWMHNDGVIVAAPADGSAGLHTEAVLQRPLNIVDGPVHLERDDAGHLVLGVNEDLVYYDTARRSVTYGPGQRVDNPDPFGTDFFVGVSAGGGVVALGRAAPRSSGPIAQRQNGFTNVAVRIIR